MRRSLAPAAALSRRATGTCSQCHRACARGSPLSPCTRAAASQRALRSIASSGVVIISCNPRFFARPSTVSAHSHHSAPPSAPFSLAFDFLLDHAALSEKDDPRTFQATSCLLEVPGGDSEHVFCMIVHLREGPFVDLNDFVADVGAILASHRQRVRLREVEEQLQREAGRRQARGSFRFPTLIVQMQKTTTVLCSCLRVLTRAEGRTVRSAVVAIFTTAPSSAPPPPL